MAEPFIPCMDFSGSPVLGDFIMSQALVRIVIGPVGSGKTTACIVEPMRRALMQEPAKADFTRHFKLLVVRNTAPDLKSTTIPSYQDVYPEANCGPVVMSSPMRHHMFIPPSKVYDEVNDVMNDVPGLNWKAEFIGLDKPKDIKKLLSYETTMIYINEIREIPREVLDRGTDRIGRYPSKDKGEPTFMGIVADTNPFDEDHWIAGMETETPAGYEIFRQPPGVVQMVERNGVWFAKEEKHDLVVTDHKRIFSAGGTLWAANPMAENIDNLSVATQLDPSGDRMGPGSYYARNVAGKDKGQIKVYYGGENGYLQEGVPVIDDYDDDVMAVSGLPVLKDVDLMVGIDVGGGTLNPSAVIGQLHPMGVWMIHAEVICESMGIKRFGDALKRKLAIPKFRGLRLAATFGDPAGAKRDELFETKIFDHMWAMHKIRVTAAPSNDPQLRVDAYKQPIGRYIEGKPGLLIHREDCPVLRQALRGRWHYKKHHSSGQVSDNINKNHPWSDVADAGGYLLMSGGEYDSLDTPVGVAAEAQAAENYQMLHGDNEEWSVWD